MEILAVSLVTTIIIILWFSVVMLIAKSTVGKDATIQQILTFLIISGPFGWIVILIIYVYDLVDKISQKKSKKSIDK